MGKRCRNRRFGRRIKPLLALASATFRSDSLRGVAILFGGSVASQVIASVANIVLARYFDPDEFGVLGLYVTISGFLVVVAAVGLVGPGAVGRKGLASGGRPGDGDLGRTGHRLCGGTSRNHPEDDGALAMEDARPHRVVLAEGP